MILAAFLFGAAVAFIPCAFFYSALMRQLKDKDLRIADLEAKTMSHTLDGYGYLAQISSQITADQAPIASTPVEEEETEEVSFVLDQNLTF